MPVYDCGFLIPYNAEWMWCTELSEDFDKDEIKTGGSGYRIN